MANKRYSYVDENDVPLIGNSRRPFPTQISKPAQPYAIHLGHKSLPSSSDTTSRFQSREYAPVHGRDTGEDLSYRRDDLSNMPPGSPLPPSVKPQVLHQPLPERRRWIPYTLRWPYLVGIISTTTILLLVIIYLSIKSRDNDGLLDVSDDKSIFFSWKFAPTLVAVIYGLLVTMILDDVKRTEPYVRLARPRGSLADFTLLQTPGAWWNAISDGFSRKKNEGRWSWSLICSATSTIYAILVISPFSSTLLVPKDVVTSKSTWFNSFPMLEQKPVTFSDQNITRFHTMSHMLQNVSTSAWLSDRFAVLPFWPSNYPTAPLSAALGSTKETWHADTLVFQVDYQCEQLHLTSKMVTNATHIYGYGNHTSTSQWDIASATLVGENGCMNGIAIYNGSYSTTYGVWSWTQPGNLTGPGAYSAFSNWPVDGTVYNHSSECTGSESLFIVGPWTQSEQITVQDCNPSYYFANVSVQASVGNGDSLVTFDEAEFLSTRTLIDDSIFDIDQLADMFLSTDWDSHLKVPIGIRRASATGPAVVIAAMYDFSASAAIFDPDLVTQVARFRQRYFGEVLRTSLSSMQPDNASLLGKIVSVKQRVAVVQSVATLLGIALLLSIILLASLFWTVSLQRRNLGLGTDPAQVALIAHLLTHGSTSRQELRKLKETSEDQRKDFLHGLRAWIEAERLSSSGSLSLNKSHVKNDTITRPEQTSNWRPFVLKRWTIVTLALILLVILAAILTLRHFSQGSGLYSKVFVYQFDLSFADRHVSTLAPYSILPTLVGVAVALWWGAMETEFRVLQPFIAMTQRGTIFKRGIKLTYQSSYWLWATVKAGRHRHWLLLIVCFGAFLSQIFTTAMSALWQLELGSRTISTTLTRALELRNIPIYSLSELQVSVHSGDTTAASVLAALYGELTQNWLYSATNALSLNGSEPVWSKDGWSFVPVDLEPLNGLDLVTTFNSTSSFATNQSAAQNMESTTIIIETPAIRARLECSDWPELQNQSRYTYSLDIKNSSLWNVSVNPDVGDVAFGLGCNEQKSTINLAPDPDTPDPCYGVLTSVYVTPVRLKCCENNTISQDGGATISYWTENFFWPQDFSNVKSMGNNITVKWMYGHPVGGFYKNGSYEEYMVWPTAPQLTALNCQPIIEKANARIELELTTSLVKHYEILEDVTVDENAWTDEFVRYNNPHRYQNNGTVEDFHENVTTSYGTLFFYALVRAANLANLGGSFDVNSYYEEDLSDNTFNFRSPGINMDTMSYCMFSQVNQNPETLLNSTTLSFLANKTFSTFFQHYVSTNVSLTSGGWAYQKINETLPADLIAQRPNDSTIPAYQAPPFSTTNRTVEVLVKMPVKKLQMSPIAAWICMGILAWMIATTIVIIAVEKRYLAKLIRGTKTLADVGILVAGSDALLTHIASGNSDYRDGQALKTKLGWFRDKDGQERWGIELYGEGCGVEWLDDNFDDESKIAKKGGYEMVNLRDRDSGLRERKRPTSPVRVAQVDDEDGDGDDMRYDRTGQGFRPT